ncbi:MAG: ribose-phosphate pyrophosphokinase [Spirochaetes bacterium]|nr:MAG: ribose-phosphate pyrophosphokinase [Spirochaetota bacterium]
MAYQFYSVTQEGVLEEHTALDVFRYPMGDVTLRVDGNLHTQDIEVVVVTETAPDWTIVYEWASLVGSSARRVLVLPYLPSARGDKDYPNPAAINARIAAASGITDVVTLDPHSSKWLDTLSFANPAIVVHELDLPSIVSDTVGEYTYLGVIGPDAGSTERASAVAQRLGLPVHICSKKRDPATGRLSGYVAPQEVIDNPGEYLVVDDICDGGGTFLLLTDAVSDEHALDLWVSHGGFTKRLHALMTRYRRVITTDSLPSAVFHTSEWSGAEWGRMIREGENAHTAADELRDRVRVVPLLPHIANAVIALDNN